MKCSICGHTTNTNSNSLYFDCGGDCLLCMASFGDPDCVRGLVKIATKLYKQLENVKTELHRGMGPGVQKFFARCIEDTLDGN